MSGDKTTAQKQATGTLSQTPRGAGHPAPCCWGQVGGMRPPGSGDGGGGQESGFQVTAQDVSFSPSPQGHDPLWHTQGGVGAGPAGARAPMLPPKRGPGRDTRAGWRPPPGSRSAGAPCLVLGEPQGGHLASRSPAGNTAQSRQPHSGPRQKGPRPGPLCDNRSWGRPQSSLQCARPGHQSSDQACPHRGNSQAQQSRGDPPHGSPRRPLCEPCQPSMLTERQESEVARV